MTEKWGEIQGKLDLRSFELAGSLSCFCCLFIVFSAIL